MDSVVKLSSSFWFTDSSLRIQPFAPRKQNPNHQNRTKFKPPQAQTKVSPDPWSLSDGNNLNMPKPRSKNPKNPLSDDNARRIIKAKARYLSVLRRNQGPQARTPLWIKRTPDQMLRYLQDDRNGHLYGKHVVAAIKTVRSLSSVSEYDMRMVMAGFVSRLTFREMCVVLKEQKSWRLAKDFFQWMKLQLCYRPSVIVYTMLLRVYGQVGKIQLAEDTFLEMLEVGLQPDEVACGTLLCTYARWGRHKAMLSFYSAAVQKRGLVPSTAVFNFMLSSLQKKALHRQVIDLWKDMLNKRVSPNGFTYTLLVASFVKENRVDEAFNTFCEMKSAGFVPEEVTYGLLINTSTKNGDFDGADTLYRDMRSQDIVPSNYTCASLLSLYHKKGNYSRALSLFSEMETLKIPVDEVIYGSLIRIYGKLGLHEDAEKTFQEIEHLGLLTDEKTYLAMAQVYVASGNPDKALGIIELMKSRNIWLSRFAYIILLKCHVMKDELNFAEATFGSLSKTGFPDAGSCNDMLNLYIKLDHFEKASNFILHIRKSLVDYDEQLAKTIMKFYCDKGKLEDAEQFALYVGTNASLKSSNFVQSLYKAMCEGDMQMKAEDEGSLLASNPNPPDLEALGLVLTLDLSAGCCQKARERLKLLLENASGPSFACKLISRFIKEGEISKAESLYYQLKSLGCKVEDEAIASLIGWYGKEQMLEKAEEIFKGAESLSPGQIVYSSMVDTYTKCNKPKDAYFVYIKAVGNGHNISSVAISILVNALSTHGKHKEAEDVIVKCLKGSSDLDAVVYNTFIKAMMIAGNLNFATSIYEHMVSVRVAPTIKTVNTMITVYGRGRRLDKAEEMFKTADSLILPLDEKAYMNLIRFYGKAGKIQEASYLFNKLQEEGINPGKVSYNIMTSVYAADGHHEEVEQIFLAMKSNGLAPDSFSYLSLIQAYAKSSKYSAAEEAIKVMQKEGISPSCIHFNCLLSAYAKAGLIGDAERVYHEMLASGLSPSLACYRTMLRGYLSSGNVDEGIAMFEQIQGSVKADKFVWSAAVHLYRSARKPEKAEEVLQAMKISGIPFLGILVVGQKMKALSSV